MNYIIEKRLENATFSTSAQRIAASNYHAAFNVPL